MYIDLVLNLALLIAISVVSGFLAQRWERRSRVGAVMQGLLFGLAAVIGMLRPVVHPPGLIFDGRSVVLSLCALFFGPLAGAVGAVIAAAARAVIGGEGAGTGILVVLSSAGIGVMVHARRRAGPLSTWELYLFGIAVHLVMLAILLTLPPTVRQYVQHEIALPVLVTFPIATMLAGRILSDQEATSRAMDALRKAQERLQQAVRAGGVGLWDWDLASNRVHFSAEWKRQIGYDDQDIADDFAEWESRIHPADRERAVRAAQGLVRGDQDALEEKFRFRHKDGTYRHILSRGSKVVDAAGQPAGVMGSHVDITALVELQGQLLQARKLETVGRLAGGIAHDFNNLLAVINGITDLVLAAMRPNDPLRPDIEQIKQAGDRAAGLTRQLLAFSRKQVLAPATLDVRTLVYNMRTLLGRVLGQDITLRVSTGPVPLCAHADAGQLEQVLMNLVVNARDAMPDGGTLAIEATELTAGADRPDLPPGDYVAIAIADTGIGMDDVTRARIFEPFFTTKEPGQGTGLGLATVYGIVTQSGGAIEVESAPGSGTRFTIYLPRVASPDVHPAAAPAAPPSTARHILVVDDEEPLRHLAARILRGAGYLVQTAGTADAALRDMQARGGGFDLLLTDLVLPGMDGHALAARVRETYPRMAIVFASGATPLDERRGQHADAVIDKPYTKAAMLATVRAVLESREEA